MKIELTKNEISLIYSALSVLREDFPGLIAPSRLESIKNLIKKIELINK